MNATQIWLLLYVVTVILAGWLNAYLFLHKNFEAGYTWEQIRQFRWRWHIMALRNFLLLTLFWPIALAAALYLEWREGKYK